eukprot:TRINITY_DN564_c0_g1_i1.p3 TRINITY_DN564_c0_g1~~TRINITY_DN564_c0_g1_i1.p3  ORF type:complete len:571 (-),score=85.77 TRINITY_DN564_c0_g1_i1:2413-4125(-)
MSKSKAKLSLTLQRFSQPPLVEKPRPFLGTDELDARLRLRYRGKCPKRTVTGNINYLDHNVLGLENRTMLNAEEVQGNYHSVTKLYDTVDRQSMKRCKSQPHGFSTEEAKKLMNKTINLASSQYSTGQRSEEYHYIQNSSKVSKVPLKQFPDESYEIYRKNRDPIIRSKSVSNKSELLDYLKEETEDLCKNTAVEEKKDWIEVASGKKQEDEVDVTQGGEKPISMNTQRTIEDEVQIEDPCPSCYNKKAAIEKAVKRRLAKEQERIERLERDAKFLEQVKAEIEKEQTKKQEKLDKEKEALTISMQNAAVNKKKTEEEAKRANTSQYNYIKLGKDHQREVEQKREQEREKRRQIVNNQLKALNEKQRALAKEMQGTKGTIETPSFIPKPDRKLEYKKLLLQQMELDREKRKLAKKLKEAESNKELFVPTEYRTNLLKKDQKLVPNHYNDLNIKVYKVDAKIKQRTKSSEKEREKAMMEKTMLLYKTNLQYETDKKKVRICKRFKIKGANPETGGHIRQASERTQSAEAQREKYSTCPNSLQEPGKREEKCDQTKCNLKTELVGQTDFARH